MPSQAIKQVLMKDKAYFWNVDLRIQVRQRWQDAACFAVLSWPVVLPNADPVVSAVDRLFHGALAMTRS